jgi:hypothetical protein
VHFGAGTSIPALEIAAHQLEMHLPRTLPAVGSGFVSWRFHRNGHLLVDLLCASGACAKLLVGAGPEWIKRPHDLRASTFSSSVAAGCPRKIWHPVTACVTVRPIAFGFSAVSAHHAQVALSRARGRGAEQCGAGRWVSRLAERADAPAGGVHDGGPWCRRGTAPRPLGIGVMVQRF